ncbi:MAG TPA: pirin family protein [Kofleriaceae bacterium]|nr:pirin family protein [Kofleriaceae bacterium]
MRTAHAHFVESRRRIAYRTKGHTHGPITRLMSPGDLGELVKPFVFLDHFEWADVRSPDAGVVHPHSGLATHTTLLEGALIYGDSTGKSGTLRAGSVEWMRAGGGVWHGGSLYPGTSLRGFQLWVALRPPLELAPAESHYVDVAAIPTDGNVRVLLGSYGARRSPIPYEEDVTYLHVQLTDGERWTYEPIASHDVAWLAVSRGTLLVDGAPIRKEMVVFEAGKAPIDVVADGAVDFVIASARQHPHPLVTGSYSVHTSEATLELGERGIEQVAKTMALRPFAPLRASAIG